jgi:hypothetical protein
MIGSYKKKWEVINASRRKVDAVDVGRRLPFGTSGAFTVSDAGEAREIQQAVGQDGSDEVVVVETDNAHVEPGHRYHFGFARKYSENFERIFSK